MTDDNNSKQYSDLTDEELGVKKNEFETESSAPENKNALKGTYEWIEMLCMALGMMLIVFMFIFRFVEVDGTSMLNTLQDKDKLMISHLFYDEPQVGDIVVIEVGSTDSKTYTKPLIKRVIATEGQTLDINSETWEITITDGDATYVLDESAYSDTILHAEGKKMYLGTVSLPYTVGEGEIFVMGDNRNNSDDSRKLGSISVENIVGRVIIRVHPFDMFGTVE
ncbi:MAG TPA: signal peptidase I [Bacillota bacterium]|nr:signal peptidase I [Bacillota bacterium]